MKMFFYLIAIAGCAVLGWNLGRIITYIKKKILEKKNKKSDQKEADPAGGEVVNE